jgi:hypothetical protein
MNSTHVLILLYDLAEAEHLWPAEVVAIPGGSSRAKPHDGAKPTGPAHTPQDFGEGSIGAFVVDPFGNILGKGVPTTWKFWTRVQEGGLSR